MPKNSPVQFTISDDGLDAEFTVDLSDGERDVRIPLSEHEVAILLRDLSQALAESVSARRHHKVRLEREIERGRR